MLSAHERREEVSGDCAQGQMPRRGYRLFMVTPGIRQLTPQKNSRPLCAVDSLFLKKHLHFRRGLASYDNLHVVVMSSVGCDSKPRPTEMLRVRVLSIAIRFMRRMSRRALRDVHVIKVQHYLTEFVQRP